MSTSSPSQDQRESAAEVLEGGLDIDLADPPTRADLTMPEGRRHSVLELPERESFDVVVRFTDGHVLRTPASTVDVTSDGTADPTSMVVRRTGLSPADLETTLREAVDSLDADPAVTGGVRDEFSGLGIELADALGPGLATFELSWAAALETGSRTAGTIAPTSARWRSTCRRSTSI